MRNAKTLIFATLCIFLLGNGYTTYAQTIETDSIFTWKLEETANPSSQSIIKFIPRSDIIPVSWDFGDGSTSTEATPTHTFNYTNWADSVAITLQYSENGTNTTKIRNIPLSPAYFFLLYDKDLGQSATYKRVFLNAFQIPNNSDSIGNLRFSWYVNGTKIDGDSFSNTSLGQWPNIYYTFPNGGTYSVKLEVSNINSAGIAEFTNTVTVIPNLTSGKIPLENIPNVFTPNSDGINDEFIVPTSGTGWFNIRIISRTGGLLYKTESSVIRWDGRNTQGNLLPNGIYYYLIEDKSGQYETATGFVYLIKDKK